VYSLSSQKWREAAGKALIDTWKKILALPYADRIIGCFPTAGNTSEWRAGAALTDPPNRRCLDHGEGFRKDFSEYLREKYHTDEALQKQWRIPTATLDNPPLPTFDDHYFSSAVDTDAVIPREKMLSFVPVPPAFNNGTHIGSFLDHDKLSHVFDFYCAWNRSTAKSQIYFAKLIKQISPDRIVGMCYGAQGCTSLSQNGRLAGTRMILESDCIDFLENPSVYENRQPGGSTGQRVVNDSFALHNKLYICQDDTRTLAENRYFRARYHVYDMTDTLNILKREFGKVVCEDMQPWWFDQLIGGKRFNYPEVVDLFARQHEILREAYSLDRTKKSEIALIFDEESFVSVSHESSSQLVQDMRNYQMARVGAQIDQYYHDDMRNPNMPSYKMYVFVNTMVLTKEEREVILAKLRREHAMAVWLYAPGFIDPEAEQRMSVEHMQALTGIRIAIENDLYDPVFRWDGEEHPICAGLDRRELFGDFFGRRYRGLGPAQAIHSEGYLYPLFRPDDPEAHVIANFCACEFPAVAVKDTGDFNSVFYGAKSLSFETLRAFARHAGVHIWNDSPDVTYVGRNYLTFHAASSGRKHLSFPEKCSLYEVYEHKYYAQDALSADFDAYFGETKMFRIERS